MMSSTAKKSSLDFAIFTRGDWGRMFARRQRNDVDAGRKISKTNKEDILSDIPGQIGHVAHGSLEEDIWRELGALPKSWKKR